MAGSRHGAGPREPGASTSTRSEVRTRSRTISPTSTNRSWRTPRRARRCGSSSAVPMSSTTWGAISTASRRSSTTPPNCGRWWSACSRRPSPSCAGCRRRPCSSTSSMPSWTHTGISAAASTTWPSRAGPRHRTWSSPTSLVASPRAARRPTSAATRYWLRRMSSQTAFERCSRGATTSSRSSSACSRMPARSGR